MHALDPARAVCMAPGQPLRGFRMASVYLSHLMCSTRHSEVWRERHSGPSVTGLSPNRPSPAAFDAHLRLSRGTFA
jgi:hypothetical protein